MTTLIEYIGIKAGGRKDTVAGTDVVWAHPGDVQPVPDGAVPALVKHVDVWRIAAVGLSDANPAVEQPAVTTEAKALAATEDQSDIETLDDAGLKALVDRQSLPVDKRKRGAALREAVRAAMKA